MRERKYNLNRNLSSNLDWTPPTCGPCSLNFKNKQKLMKQATDFCLENKASARYTCNLNSKLCGKQCEAIRSGLERLERDQEQKRCYCEGSLYYSLSSLSGQAWEELIAAEPLGKCGQGWEWELSYSLLMNIYCFLCVSLASVPRGAGLWLAGKKFTKKLGAHLLSLNDCM